MFFPSDTQGCKTFDDEIPTVASSPAVSFLFLIEEVISDAILSRNVFETVNVNPEAHTGSTKYADDNLDNEYDANYWIIKASK